MKFAVEKAFIFFIFDNYFTLITFITLNHDSKSRMDKINSLLKVITLMKSVTSVSPWSTTNERDTYKQSL